jgi:hypothetical protein
MKNLPAILYLFLIISCNKRLESKAEVSNAWIVNLNTLIDNNVKIYESDLIDFFYNQNIFIEQINGESDMGISEYTYKMIDDNKSYILSILGQSEGTNMGSRLRVTHIQIYRSVNAKKVIIIFDKEI